MVKFEVNDVLFMSRAIVKVDDKGFMFVKVDERPIVLDDPDAGL